MRSKTYWPGGVTPDQMKGAMAPLFKVRQKEEIYEAMLDVMMAHIRVSGGQLRKREFRDYFDPEAH